MKEDFQRCLASSIASVPHMDFLHQISWLLRNPPEFTTLPQPFTERDVIAGNAGLLCSLIKCFLGDMDSGSPWQLLTKTGMVVVISTTLQSWIRALRLLYCNSRDPIITSKQQLPQVCELWLSKGNAKCRYVCHRVSGHFWFPGNSGNFQFHFAFHKCIFIYALEKTQEQGLNTNSNPQVSRSPLHTQIHVPAMLDATCLARLEGDLLNPA